MKKYLVDVTRSALKDLEQISDFYLNHRDIILATRLIALLEDATKQLKLMPGQGSEASILVRETGRQYQQQQANPFRVFYRLEQNRVIIVMVLHQRQSIQKALRNCLFK